MYKKVQKMLLMLLLKWYDLQPFQVSETAKCSWFDGYNWIHAHISADTHRLT